MAQWIRRPTSNRKIEGSSPSVGAALIAQLVERALSKRKVLSSILSGSIIYKIQSHYTI